MLDVLISTFPRGYKLRRTEKRAYSLTQHSKGRTIRKVMGGGGGGVGKKPKKNSCKAKCPKKNSCKEKPKEKKFMHKMGLILTLNQNCNSSRKVFQNAPNGIRACPDFQNFPGRGCPRTPLRKWASRPS